MRTGIHLLNVVSLKYDHFFFYCKLIIFVAYVNWALFCSIGLQCMCIEQVKTEINMSCLNKKNCLIVKLKNFSCVFMSSAWTNTWGSLCQSFCLFYSFFQCQIIRKLAISTTLHPKCLSLVKKLQYVPIVQKKVTMFLFLCSIKIRSQLKHAK
jgi:hypothetical protein